MTKTHLIAMDRAYSLGAFIIMFCVILSGECFAIAVGDYVRVQANVAARIGAGTANAEISSPYYSAISTGGYGVNPGTVGLVTDGPTPANGYTWWQVTWGQSPISYSGWSVESSGGETRLASVNTETRPCGVDVSSDQGTINLQNWQQVYNSGQEFTFVRATQGDDSAYDDGKFVSNMSAGHSAGLLMGAYHLAYPNLNSALTGPASAESEALHFVDVAGPYLTQGYLRPALDLEEPTSGTTDYSAWVDEWIQTVKSQTGVEPIIFTTPSYANAHLTAYLTKYSLWISNWLGNINAEPNTSWWSTWNFWQYNGDNTNISNDEAMIPGIASKVDADMFNGTLSSLTSQFVIGQSQDTTPPTISAFSVNPTSVIVGSPVTISYTASDTGGSGLKTAQLWRAPDDGYGVPGTWGQVGSSIDISAGGNGPFNGSFSDTPPLVGEWWYGVHVVDGANPSNWNDEQNSQTNGVPGIFGPIQVTVAAAPVNISVTVQPNPSGRSFTVDGTPYTTSQNFSWVSGSNHMIAATSPQSAGAGIQYVWSSWSDSGAMSHTVAPTVGTTYTVNFTTQYYLTMSMGTGGSSVSPSSGWYNSGASVGISATAASGYTFSSWTGTGSGSYSGSSSSSSVTMNAPITETGTFTGAPEISVEGWYLGNAENIFNGKGNPEWGDGTYFGTVLQNSTSPTRTYTVQNTGTAPLIVGTPTVPSGFTIIEPLNAIIAAGGSDDFTVQMSTSTVGTISGNVSIPNNAIVEDGVEYPFQFTIAGTVMYVGAAATTTVLNISPSTAVYGQPVMFKAAVGVIPPGSGTPTGGTVTFMDATTPLGWTTLNNRNAVFTTTSLAMGQHLVTAMYSGDGSNFSSSSTSIGSNLIISTVAGNGTFGSGGDGGLATSASLFHPWGVAVDRSGNVFIADTTYGRVREVLASTGIIILVAGGGTGGLGDNGPATAASLSAPEAVAVDNNGNLFIADTSNQRIRKVVLSTGIITTVAGDGTYGSSGDGSQAIAAKLNNPGGVAVDGSGNVFIADTQNGRIRKVNLSTGIITTVAGGGTGGLGDNGPATTASLSGPFGVMIDTSGNIFIADSYHNRIRVVDHTTHIITTVAGNGSAGFGGDGGQAVAASLNNPWGIATDNTGHLFIADCYNYRIREVNLFTNTITTIAGGGSNLGDNGPAAAAGVGPFQIAADTSGNLFIADASYNRIREIAAGNMSVNVIPAIADVDMDGDVDFVDFAIFANHWTYQNCAEPDWCEGTDFDHSGSVDMLDLATFAEYWLSGS